MAQPHSLLPPAAQRLLFPSDEFGGQLPSEEIAPLNGFKLTKDLPLNGDGSRTCLRYLLTLSSSYTSSYKRSYAADSTPVADSNSSNGERERESRLVHLLGLSAKAQWMEQDGWAATRGESAGERSSQTQRSSSDRGPHRRLLLFLNFMRT